MTTPQKPQSRVIISVLFIVLTLATLMVLVYGLVQRTQAMFMEKQVVEIRTENENLSKLNEELSKELDEARAIAQQIQLSCEEKLKGYKNSK